MIISKTSVLTGVKHERDINITSEQLEQWRMGKHIQWVCPQLSVEDREFLLSGSTPEEWKDAFPEVADES